MGIGGWWSGLALVDSFPPLLLWESGPGCLGVPGRRGVQEEGPLLPQIMVIRKGLGIPFSANCPVPP